MLFTYLLKLSPVVVQQHSEDAVSKEQAFTSETYIKCKLFSFTFPVFLYGTDFNLQNIFEMLNCALLLVVYRKLLQ